MDSLWLRPRAGREKSASRDRRQHQNLRSPADDAIEGDGAALLGLKSISDQICCQHQDQGGTHAVDLDARLGQDVGVLVGVPHKVGRLAALVRAVEDGVPG